MTASNLHTWFKPTKACGKYCDKDLFLPDCYYDFGEKDVFLKVKSGILV